jgi:gluconate kinase
MQILGKTATEITAKRTNAREGHFMDLINLPSECSSKGKGRCGRVLSYEFA